MAGTFQEYIVAHVAAVKAIEDAIAAAKVKAGDRALDMTARGDASALVLDLGVQLQELARADVTFRGKFSIPTPPSQSDIDEAISAANRLAQEVAANLLATGRLNLVVDIIGAFSELANKPGPAPAPAAADALGVNALGAAVKKVAKKKATAAPVKFDKRVMATTVLAKLRNPK